MTPEEIINLLDEEFYKENSYYLSLTEPEEFAKQVAIKFGKLAFEAAREQRPLAKDYAYHTFEDYLKELYGETTKKT